MFFSMGFEVTRYISISLVFIFVVLGQIHKLISFYNCLNVVEYLSPPVRGHGALM